MKNLLPDFILENYKNNVFGGNLKAFTMFADISGFTPMTERLMRSGNEGAEALSNILTSIFKPTVKCVYNSGGFITNYAGDSFTSIIPVAGNSNSQSSQAVKALHCANNILTEFKKQSIVRTGFGNVSLNVRIGMSFGDVEWAIVGKANKSFYFRGDAINTCADAQKHTEENEILFHKRVYDLLKGNGLTFSRKGQFYCVNSFPEKTDDFCALSSENNSPLTRQIFSKHFFPESVLKAKDTGEFREVASVFISFDHSLHGDIINELFNIIVEAVGHYSGYLKDIEFGDKGGVIVCYFGAPLSFDEDVQRTVTFVRSIKKKLAMDGVLKKLELKIGITFGRVYTGFIGSDERVQYTVLGNVVNLCSRLMTNAGWNEIWISEEACRRLKDKSNFVPVGSFPFKGFKNKILVYKFSENNSLGGGKRESNKTDRVDLRHRYTGDMIGRNDEIEKLRTFTEEIFANRISGIIYLTGEAGIGKSKLVKEFRKEYSSSNIVSWMYSYATEILNRPLSPFKYLLKNFFKQSSSNTPEENKRVFENITDIIIKRLDNLSIENKQLSSRVLQVRNELIRTKSILAAMIDIYWAKSLYEQLEPELRSENTLFAICNFVIAECMIQPVVMEIEDVHWMDNDSWDVLRMLLNNVTDLPLTIICTTRYALHKKKQLTDTNKKRYEIRLEYFDLEDIKLFAKEILNGKIDDRSAEYILHNTNGNPYFIEQLVLDLKEKEIWKRKKDIFSLTEFDDENLPSTINSVLVSRFDRLPGDVKNVVQTASVLGREFELKVLKQMFPGDDELESKLNSAERENIWHSGEEGKYIFTHALLCKAVHDMQLKSEVNELHLLAAESVKKLSGKKISHHNSEQLAYHLGLGHNIVNSKNKSVTTKARLKNSEFRNNLIEYVSLQTTIADKYKTDYRNEKALELYDLILSLLWKLNDKEKAYHILLKKVEILNNISRWDDAKKEVDKAIKIAKGMKDKYREMVGKKALAEIFRFQKKTTRSLRLNNQVLEFCNFHYKHFDVIAILNEIAILQLQTGDYKTALMNLDLQYALAKKIKCMNEIVKSQYYRGLIFRIKGEYAKAISVFKNCLNYISDIEDKTLVATLLRSVGALYYFTGNFDNSIIFFERAKIIFRDIGNKDEYAKTLGNIGNFYLANSNFSKAEQYYIDQIELSKSISNQFGVASGQLNLGTLLLNEEKYSEALSRFKKLISVFKRFKSKNELSILYSNIGIIYEYKKKFDLALKYFFLQLETNKSNMDREGIIRAYSNIANQYNFKKHLKQSVKYHSESVKIAEKYKITSNIHSILYNFAEALLIYGNSEKSLYVCNKIFQYHESANNSEVIILSKILRERIKIARYITKDLNLKISPFNNIRISISKIEQEVSNLNEKRNIAIAQNTLSSLKRKLENLEANKIRF